jgi:dTDP-4-dehydrorhamnose 3,5-epimerase
VIDGVTLKDIITHGDDRGFFREIIRGTDDFFADGFGQLSHSLVQQGVLKAWHGHVHQTQWTYAASGVLRVAIHDLRPDSPTRGVTEEVTIGDGHAAVVYRLPPGVVHGYRCVAGPAHVIYVTSGTYDPADEVRVPHDGVSIAYDWTEFRSSHD